MRARGQRAFTLIEIMIVIMILGVLASSIIPRVAHRTYDGKRAKAVADIALLKAMVEQVRLDIKRYPTADEGLGALTVAPVGVKNWQGPYIQSVPQDPWGNRYVYTASTGGSQGETFDVVCYGADGAAGGTGEDADISDENSRK